MIEYAGKYGAVLKLLDLMNMPQETRFLSQYYMPLDAIENDLAGKAQKSSLVTPPRGIGTPMPTFEMASGAIVMIKDARKGTWYGDTCKDCRHYKCQDALMALRITSDGCLQRCLLRSDNLVDLLSLLEGVADQVDIDTAIKNVLQTYEGAVFHPQAWNV
jgi:molybdenum cofactor biosynthesis enzyme MoaA